MNITKIVKNTNYPAFIRQPITNLAPEYQQITKIFPLIGLDNFKIDLADIDITKQQFTCASIRRELLFLQRKLTFCKINNTSIRNLISIIAVLQHSLARYEQKSIIINCPLAFNTKTISIKKSEHIASVVIALYKKALAACHNLSKPLLYDAIDTLISNLICRCAYGKTVSLHFSSTGAGGVWDIATMSMRGISSCMRWRGEYSKALVGSIMDPCCGVVYVSGWHNTGYGRNMRARGVVRYVLDTENKPHLVIEPIYVAGEEYQSHKKHWLIDVFKTIVRATIRIPVSNKKGKQIPNTIFSNRLITNHNKLKAAWMQGSTYYDNPQRHARSIKYLSYSDHKIPYTRQVFSSTEAILPKSKSK